MKIKTRIFCLSIILSLILGMDIPWQATAQSGETRVFLPILHDRFDTGPGDIKGEVIDAVVDGDGLRRI